MYLKGTLQFLLETSKGWSDLWNGLEGYRGRYSSDSLGGIGAAIGMQLVGCHQRLSQGHLLVSSRLPEMYQETLELTSGVGQRILG